MNNKKHYSAILLWPARTLTVLALAAIAPAVSAAEQQPAARPAATSSAGTANSKPTALEQSLGLLKQDDKAGAVRKFMEINCKAGPLFSPKSPMTTAEKDLPGMSATDQEQLISKVMAGLKDLKQLAGAVKGKAVAEAGTNTKLARQYFAQLNDLGTALDSPEALKIVQLTGQSLCKMSAAESAKLPK